jgi:hypothetical protein
VPVRHSLRKHGARRSGLRSSSLRTALLASLGVAAVALSAGCGAPTVTKFEAFPVSKAWTGPDGLTFQPVFGPRTGGPGKKTFTMAGGPNMVVWFACIGTGTAEVTSPDMALDWTVQCGRQSPDPGGIQLDPSHAPAGAKVTVDLVIPAKARYLLRVDAPKPLVK